ncbi:MAG: hypothetical protein JO345_01365 [Streptosporangiaceae bacterium]|nr:hypothetical protein [Streptosporangiaceae bacterium]
MSKYTLTLRNNSTNPSWTFAIYTNAPISNTNQFALAWLTKRVNSGNSVTFTWELKYSLMFAAQGFKNNVPWTENRSVEVNPNSWDQNAALLSYSGGDYQFQLEPKKQPADPGKVFINTDSTVPSYNSSTGPTVALAIATGDDGTPTPAIGGTSGPNLLHTFTLHPSYYIQAGDVEQGQMADLDTLNNMQEVTYVAGTYSADWTLNDQNIWVPTNQLVMAGV